MSKNGYSWPLVGISIAFVVLWFLLEYLAEVL